MLLEYGNTHVNEEWKIDEKIPPGYSRVYYVYDGEVEYEDDQRRMLLKKGHLYIFPSAAVYRMNQNPQNRLYCTFLHLDVFPTLITELVELPIEETPLLQHILFAFAASIEKNDVKLTFALSDVFEIYCKEHEIFHSPVKQISYVLLYIAKNIEQNITIEVLSKIAGYNEQYFIRLFKKTVGVTPHQYILSYRLKESKKLLKTDLSITLISKMTGYGDMKSFSRSFQNNYGLSPTTFRKMYTVRP
jgi:Transcriptional regulator containing an amidase domain and an AraC-type DNA-binding HTH domain